MSTFGEMLATARKEAGLTQRELAAAVGVDHTYISKMEGNKLDRAPAALTLKKLAKATQMNAYQAKAFAEASGLTVEVPLAEYNQFHKDIRQLNRALRYAWEIVHYNGPAHVQLQAECSIASCAYFRGVLMKTSQHDEEEQPPAPQRGQGREVSGE